MMPEMPDIMKNLRDRMEKIEEETETLTRELRSIKRSLRDLAVHKRSLLETQRYLADCAIVSTFNEMCNLATSQKRLKTSDFCDQLAVEVSAAISNIAISEALLVAARLYRRKWFDDLEKLGVKFFRFPDF